MTNTLKIQTRFYSGAHFLSSLLNFLLSLHNFFSVLSLLVGLGNFLSSGFTLCAYRMVVLSPRLVLFASSVFFYGMVALVQPQEGPWERLGKSKCIILPGPIDGVTTCLAGHRGNTRFGSEFRRPEGGESQGESS